MMQHAHLTRSLYFAWAMKLLYDSYSLKAEAEVVYRLMHEQEQYTALVGEGKGITTGIW